MTDCMEDIMSEYTGASIKILTDTEHVRKRPSMYIGDIVDPRHLFSEIYDNALDEVMNGFSKKISVYVDTSTNCYSVRDYGRGLPQDKKIDLNGDERWTIDIIFNKLNAGGKYDNESYKISGGIHGVGSTVTNALSSQLTATSYRKNHVLSLTYVNGGQLLAVEETTERGTPDGTLVSFIPDASIFESDIIPIEFIKQRCLIADAFGYKTDLYIDNKLCNDIHSEIYDLISDDGEFSEYCRYADTVTDSDTGEKLSFAIRYTNDTSCHSRGFTNLLPNSQGGTHIRMFERAFEDAWSRWKIDDVSVRDYYLGLRFVVAAFISETAFSSQTKERLTTDKKYLEKFIPMISNSIYKWLRKNEEIREGLIKRFQEYRASQNKLLSKKELKNLIMVNNDTSGSVRRKSVVAKLAECSSKSKENTELFILEGESASGSAIQARDPSTQAILPIRGKTLNVSKFSDYAQCLKNEEVRSIVNAMGTGILDDCDVSKARYDKLIIMSDADSDGLSVQSLVIAMIVNLMPEVVKHGMLYIANPPLYGWKDKSGKNHYTNNIDDISKEYEIHRYKGLGEMNYEDLRETTMDPNTRVLTPINYPDDINRFNEIMTSAKIKYDILVELGLISYR